MKYRCKTLSRKIAEDPVLPLLGWTKCVETIVDTGPTGRWAFYAMAVSFLWVFAEVIRQRAEETADDVQESIDGAVDD